MLKFHPIPAFMKTNTNFKKTFLVEVFWLKIFFELNLIFLILDLMFLPKTSVLFEGLYSSKKARYSLNWSETPRTGFLAIYVGLYTYCRR